MTNDSHIFSLLFYLRSKRITTKLCLHKSSEKVKAMSFTKSFFKLKDDFIIGLHNHTLTKYNIYSNIKIKELKIRNYHIVIASFNHLTTFATSANMKYFVKSHDLLTGSSSAIETIPLKVHRSSLLIIKPAPLSPVHGPFPSCFPAQNVASEVKFKKALCDLRHVSCDTTGSVTFFGSATCSAPVSSFPQPATVPVLQ